MAYAAEFDHGGMSMGILSSRVGIEEGIPILKDRLKKFNY